MKNKTSDAAIIESLFTVSIALHSASGALHDLTRMVKLAIAIYIIGQFKSMLVMLALAALGAFFVTKYYTPGLHAQYTAVLYGLLQKLLSLAQLR